MPTLLELFDLKYNKKKIEGVSLFNAIEGKTGKRILTAFLAPDLMHIPGKLAIISGENKLIYSKKLTPEDLSFFTHPPKFEMYELYNIVNDQYEKENIFRKDLFNFHSSS